MKIVVSLALLFLPFFSFSQDARSLVNQVKAKLQKVNDYQARGILTTDIPFMKVPQSEVEVYYKKPNKFRVKRQEGISVIPKGGISFNVNALLWGDGYSVIGSGTTILHGSPVSIVKLLPHSDQDEVVLSTLYIDKNALIRKASTTTRNHGTYDMEMSYGKYASWGLPDKVWFSFDTKRFKLPKGVTFEYDTGEKPKASSSTTQSGKVEIVYTNYSINKGVDDTVFTTGK